MATRRRRGRAARRQMVPRPPRRAALPLLLACGCFALLQSAGVARAQGGGDGAPNPLLAAAAAGVRSGVWRPGGWGWGVAAGRNAAAAAAPAAAARLDSSPAPIATPPRRLHLLPRPRRKHHVLHGRPPDVP
jgi:hypothetical protein